MTTPTWAITLKTLDVEYAKDISNVPTRLRSLGTFLTWTGSGSKAGSQSFSSSLALSAGAVVLEVVRGKI